MKIFYKMRPKFQGFKMYILFLTQKELKCFNIYKIRK